MLNKIRTGLFLLAVMLLLVPEANAWGFFAHKKINRIAVFTLPEEMLSLFKTEIEFLTEHAVDPDKRRYAIENEAPRHYIDLDHYCTYPCADFPRSWVEAEAIYGEDSLLAYGIVPWHILSMKKRLTEAFRSGDKFTILKTAADLGHYVADAHVPLHTSENYNGQMTDQIGIHGFWESRIPELFAEDYDFWAGKAEYISHPQEWVWNVVMGSNTALDTVLSFEKQLDQTFPADRKYSYETRGALTVRVYSEEYSKAYSDMMGDLVERRMRLAIKHVGDIWYSCWVDAQKPQMQQIEEKQFTQENIKEMNDEENDYQKRGNIKGRAHDETGTDGF